MTIPKKAGKPGLDPRDALDILEIRADEIQAYLAQHPDIDKDVLQYLAKHGAPAVRQAVAGNVATPAAANRLLADDEEEAVRAELAVKIARLMPGLEERETAHVVALTIETLECLARDSAEKVRAILSEEIKHLNCVPHGVVMSLAYNLEIAVCGPVLEYSPLLSDADLMEIIACGQVQERLAVIAQRKPLSENVSDVLVKALDVPAIAALLVNTNARVRAQTMDRIIAEAEKIDAWHMPLVLRADLSARAIRRIAGFVGAGLIEMLALRSGLDKTTQTHLNRRLRARLEESSTNPDTLSAEAAARHVAAAQASGELDDAFLDDAIFAGRRETVIFALAALARVSDATVRKILSCGHAKPLVALAWHAGVSMRIAFKIQGLIMKLPSQELLPARDGVHFPLTAEEMRWHLNFFNIDA